MPHKNPPKTPAIVVRKAPKQHRSKKMVETILEAAAHILEEGTSFTTNHIAQKAGVSIGSLYQYFPSVEAIMATLLEKHVADEREMAEAILATSREGEVDRERDVMRDLLVAFIDAHADAPRLTGQLHALASSFNLQDHLTNARDAQALRIAQIMGLPEADVLMSVIAVEGVVLATLANDPAQLKSNTFIDKLYAIAMAPLESR